MGSSKIQGGFFEVALEEGVDRFYNHVKSLVDSLLLSKHIADFGKFRASSSVRKNGISARMGGGGGIGERTE